MTIVPPVPLPTPKFCPRCGRPLTVVAQTVKPINSIYVRKGWACTFCKVVVQLHRLHARWKTT